MSIRGDVKITRRDLLVSSSLLPGFFLLGSPKVYAALPDYPVAAVPFTDVDIHDEFWNPRIEANRSVSIWHCFEKMQENGDFGDPRLIEAAAYMLAKRRDPKLEEYVNQRIDKLVAALEPRLSDPEQAVRVSGHFLEAGAVWFDVAANRKMVDAARRDADAINAAYGPGSMSGERRTTRAEASTRATALTPRITNL